MPLYSVHCNSCNTRDVVFRKIDDRNNLPVCDFCDGALVRVIDAPAVHAEFEGYVSPGTGRYIDSRDAQRADLKASGCFIAEKGVDKDVERGRKAREEKDFAPIASAVDETVRALVNSGQLES